MTNITPTPPNATRATTIRRARVKHPSPLEAGADLLRATFRITAEEASVLEHARAILLKLSASRRGIGLTSPQLVREYLITLLAAQEREFFVLVAVDTRHRVLASEILFAGTIDGSPVFPREVVRCALRHGASAVVIGHNHPSYVAEPSHADELVTARVRDALSLVDIKLLDHFVIGGGHAYSFSEAGRL